MLRFCLCICVEKKSYIPFLTNLEDEISVKGVGFVTSQNPNFGIHKSLSKVFELKFGTGIQLETRKQMHKGFIRLVNIS
jgi:hypothetical protein